MRLRAFTITALGLLCAVPLQGSETWVVRTNLWGNPAFSTLTIDREKTTISGDLDGDRVTGELETSLYLLARQLAQAQLAWFSDNGKVNAFGPPSSKISQRAHLYDPVWNTPKDVHAGWSEAPQILILCRAALKSRHNATLDGNGRENLSVGSTALF